MMMTMSIIFTTIVALSYCITSSSPSFMQQPALVDQVSSYDYTIIALQWAKRVRKVTNCKRDKEKVPKKFLIHARGQEISTIVNKKVDDCDQLSTFPTYTKTVEDMKAYWVDLYSEVDNNNLWVAEWRMHGSCAQNERNISHTPEDYCSN
ncbi:hypothetical protein RIF29_37791 [Crotalaria pallida]|uniref:Uncharacterized protein n=1 Tax=Crotalaria pallida TaxID=3830 RepID=A0AAN9E112_CROPI